MEITQGEARGGGNAGQSKQIREQHAGRQSKSSKAMQKQKHTEQAEPNQPKPHRATPSYASQSKATIETIGKRSKARQGKPG